MNMSDAIRIEVLPLADGTPSTAPANPILPEGDGLGAARGILSGIVLALPFWALVVYLFW